MARLSESQLVVLNAACKRDGRSVYPLTIKVPAGAVQKILTSLLNKELIEEVRAKREDEVWREDKNGDRFTLRATSTADAALGITEGDAPAEPAPVAPANGKKKGRAPKPRKENAPRAPRTDTKQARLIEMLKRAKGATIEEVVKELDWQPHTVRGAIAGALKNKLKLKVSSEKTEGRGRVYRIEG